jgi:hypothetical protein
MNIISTYEEDWKLFSKLQIEWPYTQQEIYSAFESEDFDYTQDLRVVLSNPKNQILQDLIKLVHEKISLHLLNEICLKDEFVNDLWGLETKEQMLANIITLCSVICDKPGYTTNTHIDCKTNVCVGMFFFNEFDDPDQATFFYTSFSENDPARTSSQYGNGWYLANTHYSWHKGSNNSSRKRYSLYFTNNLNLKI